MSSRVFKANTSHSDGNPQLCGLTQSPIQEGDWCFYMVCKGTAARPEWQVNVVREEETTFRGRKSSKKIRETPDGQPFFSVFTGQWETFKKPDGKVGRRRVYEWQTEDPITGARIPVVVWSNMVLVSSAEKLGYTVPKNSQGKYVTTKAFQGDRTVGFEHRSAQEAEPAMVTIAKASLSDEEAGVIPPKDEIGEPSEADLAAALGITVSRYRALVAEYDS